MKNVVSISKSIYPGNCKNMEWVKTRIMSFIELKNIDFSYSRKSKSNLALSSVNLQIAKGESITILGPNGSGKSTLLKIISGVIDPDKGERHLNGKVYQKYSRRDLARKIAYVSQKNFSIFPFSVFEIVMMGRTPHLGFLGYENQTDIEKVNRALEVVEISHLKNKGINEISGGEAQRAFIARALVQEPEVILLDEPNAHLDIKHQISIFHLIRNLNSEKDITVITVSHDLNLAGYFNKRAILLNNGSLFADDKVENILTEKNIKEVFGVNSRVSGSVVSIQPEL